MRLWNKPMEQVARPGTYICGSLKMSRIMNRWYTGWAIVRRTSCSCAASTSAAATNADGGSLCATRGSGLQRRANLPTKRQRRRYLRRQTRSHACNKTLGSAGNRARQRDSYVGARCVDSRCNHRGQPVSGGSRGPDHAARLSARRRNDHRCR